MIEESVKAEAENKLYHFSSGMHGLNAPQNRGSIIRNDHFSLGCLDLRNIKDPGARSTWPLPTILSIPRGPRDVLTASLIAK
jgi:hypothetical protein